MKKMLLIIFIIIFFLSINTIGWGHLWDTKEISKWDTQIIITWNGMELGGISYKLATSGRVNYAPADSATHSYRSYA